MPFFCIQLWKTAADSAFHVILLLTLHVETKCQATFVPNLPYFKVSIPAVTETQAEFVHSLCQSMSPSKLQQQDNTYPQLTGWQQGHYVPFKSLSPGTNTLGIPPQWKPQEFSCRSFHILQHTPFHCVHHQKTWPITVIVHSLQKLFPSYVTLHSACPHTPRASFLGLVSVKHINRLLSPGN